MILNDIKDDVLILLDLYDRNKANVSNAVADIVAKMPFYANIAQKKLVKVANLTKTYDLVHTDDLSGDIYVSYDLGTLIADLGTIKFIIDTQSDKDYLKTTLVKLEGKILYIANSYKGTLRIVYTPSPVKLTTMNDTLILDDDTVMLAMTYFIAYNLILTDDAQKANLYLQEYENNVAELTKRDMATQELIVDVY